MRRHRVNGVGGAAGLEVALWLDTPATEQDCLPRKHFLLSLMGSWLWPVRGHHPSPSRVIFDQIKKQPQEGVLLLNGRAVARQQSCHGRRTAA